MTEQATSNSSGRKGVALHIAVNRVDPAHYGGSWDGALASPENDADTMQEIARAQGFETRQIKTEQATRRAVREAILEVAGQLRSGDMFLLTYAGHGGQIRDLSGEEADRKDDTWILYDGHLLDDELNFFFSHFAPGCRILMVSDSCHSGTLLKGANDDADEVEREEDDFIYPRLIPRNVAVETEKQHIGRYARIQRELPRPHPPIQASVRLLSGCLEHERSWGNKETGRFTAALKKVFADGTFDGGYEQFHGEIVEALKTAMNPQTPAHMVVGEPDPDFDRQPPLRI